MSGTPARSPASTILKLCIASTLAASAGAHAADWSDTSLSWRYGTKFEEPYNGTDISKNILALTHASGYKYGTNYFNVDFLMSDHNDPTNISAAGVPSGSAQEAYIVYRHTLDLGKVSGSDMKFGFVRGVGITAGFDVNSKNDFGYSSRKRMLVLGPTLMLDVPGFLNVSLLLLNESNQPQGITSRYTYDNHAMLNAAWGIPVPTGSVPSSFEGYANFIASKGKNEFGGPTSAETNIDMQWMFDIGAVAGGAKNTFKLGVEYQYWKNKFGNPSNVPGSKATTPMIRAEYHF